MTIIEVRIVRNIEYVFLIPVFGLHRALITTTRTFYKSATGNTSSVLLSSRGSYTITGRNLRLQSPPLKMSGSVSAY